MGRTGSCAAVSAANEIISAKSRHACTLLSPTSPDAPETAEMREIRVGDREELSTPPDTVHANECRSA